MTVKKFKQRVIDRVDERYDSGKHVILSNVMTILHEEHQEYTSDYIDERGIYPPGHDSSLSDMREALKALFRDHVPERDEVVTVIKRGNYNPEVEHIFN